MQKISPCRVNSGRDFTCSHGSLKTAYLIFLSKYFVLSVFTLILVLLLLTVEVKMEK